MNHADHVALIRAGVAGSGNVWAELGSGRGAFTLALADCLGSGAVIHAVDQDRSALREQSRLLNESFPDTVLVQYEADFTRRLDLPSVDGVLIANALHFVEDALPVLTTIHRMLEPQGRLVVVEYGTDRGNRWVPYPISFDRLAQLCTQAEFATTRLLSSRPSRFLGTIYSAVAYADVVE